MQKTLLKKSMNLFLCGILSTAVLLGGCGIGNTANTQKEEQPAAAVQQEVKLSGARNTPVVVAAQKVGPAVVGITNKAYVRDFFNRVQLTERGTGSGVIYDKSGLIATNNHVVEGAQEIIVSLTDGRSVKGKVLGADAATDLAVVKIDVDEDLPVAKFGDSSTLQVGEPAIAIGNPLGLEFRGSVTVGVISALNRSIELGDRKFNLIQTDAAINPGNSGGALVNADGEVVGINSAKVAVSGVEGIGFAIPVNSAKPILDELAQHGRIARPYIGASLIDKDISARYGFDLDLHGGIFVMKIVTGGPVYNAGMRPGDIILTFDGAKVETVPELRTKLAEKKVGDTVAIVVLRAGIERILQVTLQEMPEGN
ncbi:trypsin-like peptidase domain-containing protein [Phascolarctobacterium faecium]|nr:trypsin-like peptidase domain-containing protein [Phascolarctobacterium faecium]MDM8110530.1 trypsin-like peptidase domain-containing protein [Phascolarctobacterium faecium]